MTTLEIRVLGLVIRYKKEREAAELERESFGEVFFEGWRRNRERAEAEKKRNKKLREGIAKEKIRGEGEQRAP